MPSTPIRLPSLFACLLIFAGCVEGTGTPVTSPPVSARAEVSRLNSLGFKTTARTSDGSRAMSYSGRVTRAVVCRTGKGPYGQLPARSRSSDGSRTEVTLDAYLQLSPGNDGVLTADERSGVYAVTILNRAKNGRSINRLERITFAPNRTGTSKSGLTCRAA